jgi:peptidoglycan hydrolase-like protein with peptidoglycan-binding domain
MVTKKTTENKPAKKNATPKAKIAPVKEQKKPAPKAEKKVVSIKPKKEPEVIELPSINTFPSIRKGSRETGYITLLQTNLKNRGYYDGKVDGEFGDKTEQAVMEFQKDLKKPLNGTVGSKTWEALQKSDLARVKLQPVAIPVQPVVQQPAPGYKVVVEGLTRYQADLLVKLLQGHTECRII